MAVKIVKTGAGEGLEPSTSDSNKTTKANASANTSTKSNMTPPRKVVESILTRLACGDGPREVMAGIKEEFDITLKPWHVSYYDPRNATSKGLKQEHKDLFYRLHREYISHMENVTIAHARARLDRLDRIYDKAMAEGNLKAATNAIKESRIEMVEYTRKDTPPTTTQDTTGQNTTGSIDEE